MWHIDHLSVTSFHVHGIICNLFFRSFLYDCLDALCKDLFENIYRGVTTAKMQIKHLAFNFFNLFSQEVTLWFE